MRRWKLTVARGACAAIAAIAVSLALSAIAMAAKGEVRHTGTFVTETLPYGPPEEPRCTSTLFFQWAELPGAVSYTVQLEDTITGSYTTTFPPYTGDGPVNGHDPAPKGTHRQGLNSGSGPAPCVTEMNGGRWTVKKLTANFCGPEPVLKGERARQDACPTRIVGTVTEADGTGVPGVQINISGEKGARTNGGGGYGAKVRGGSKTVSAPKGYCVVGEKRCKNSTRVSVNAGDVEAVNFTQKNLLFVDGTVEDEFGRGLEGVRMSLTGADSDNDTTNAAGEYRLEVEEPGTYGLTAAGSGRGPNETYYILQDGVSSGGVAADVTLGGPGQESSATVDWELDKRLQFRLTARDPARADGVSRTLVTLRALTQHGDPAPGVELNVDPPTSATPRAVICSTGGGPGLLWPAISAEGEISPAGIPVGPETTTDNHGEVSFRLFPGTEPGGFQITGSRRNTGDGPSSVFAETIQFVQTNSRAFNRDQLARAFLEGGVGAPILAARSVLFERLAAAQPETGNGLSGIDAVPLYTSETNRTGTLFYSRGTLPPDFAASRATLPSQEGSFADSALVLEDLTLEAALGDPALPTLREWAGSEVVFTNAVDARTFLGWPVPTTANAGLGTCLSDRLGSERYVFAAHSPVDLLLSGPGGKLGIDPRGKEHADLPGAAFSAGETDYIVAPRGQHKLTITGTGSGPVVLEARNGTVAEVAKFRAKKDSKATFSVADGGLKTFRFAGEKVKPEPGVPLLVKGVPKRLKVNKKTALKVKLTDVFGTPVPDATLQVSGAAGTFTVQAAADGRITTNVRPRKAGKVRLVFSAPDLVGAREVLRVRR